MNKEDLKNDAVVYALSRPSRCYGCDRRLLPDEIVKLTKQSEESEVFCRNCGGLAELVIVPKGNQTVTRLAKKYSKTSLVVLKWSDLWKCYERQGLLVEKQALERAQNEVTLP